MVAKSLGCKSSQILCDLITCTWRVISSLDHLLLLLLPFRIQSTYFEMFSNPFTFSYHLLAIRTFHCATWFLSVSTSRLIRSASLSYVVFLYLHIRIKCRAFWQLLSFSLCLRICLDNFNVWLLWLTLTIWIHLNQSYLIRIRHTLQLFILLHMHLDLLLKEGRLLIMVVFCYFYHLIISFLLFHHFFIIVKFNFLHYYEIMPIDFFRGHLTVFFIKFRVICSLLPRYLLLLSLVHLPMFPCFSDFENPFCRISESSISLKCFELRFHYSAVRFYQIRKVVE